jgi:hypothetical protein
VQAAAEAAAEAAPPTCQDIHHPTGPCGAVVVCAPTGAGKTAIAEAAALHFLARGRRIIYTTPLKALSNQKLGEMRARFGWAGRCPARPLRRTRKSLGLRWAWLALLPAAPFPPSFLLQRLPSSPPSSLPPSPPPCQP